MKLSISFIIYSLWSNHWKNSVSDRALKFVWCAQVHKRNLKLVGDLVISPSEVCSYERMVAQKILKHGAATDSPRYRLLKHLQAHILRFPYKSQLRS